MALESTGKLFHYDNTFFHRNFEIPMGRVFQVSELSVIRGGEIVNHHQICEEMTYIVSGKGRFYCNGECKEVGPGQIHFIRRGNSHHIEVSEDENLRYICIGIQYDESLEVVRSLYHALGSKNDIVLDDTGTIKGLSEYLIREFYSQDDKINDMINSYIYQITVTLERIISGNVITYENNKGEKSSSYAIYLILRYLDREYLQIKNVCEIAEKLSYSEYYLSHLFKRKMGITIKDYLTNKKLSYAMQLLETSELSVEKISDSLGFSSAHSFRRMFKKYTGLSPSEYKHINFNKENNSKIGN